MPVTLMCPTCHGAVAVPDELLGGTVTCPYCRNAFLAPVPLPPPPAPLPPPANAFSFDAPADNEEDDDDRPRKRDRRGAAAGPQQVELTAGSWIVIAVVAAISVGLGIGMRSFPKWEVNGINLTQTICVGVIGGVAAGGIALARSLGKPKGGNSRNRR